MSSFFVYIINPLGTQKSYVGFSTNYLRRLRQHNKIIKGGAKKTSKDEKWCLVCVVSGFPTKKDALSFEWALQHPYVSKKYRDAVKAELFGKRGMGHRGSVGRRILELHIMLQSHPELSLAYSNEYVDLEKDRRKFVHHRVILESQLYT